MNEEEFWELSGIIDDLLNGYDIEAPMDTWDSYRVLSNIFAKCKKVGNF